MNKKLIFIDIDGTLLNHATGEIPASSLQAIQQARANGHRIFLCTGRPLPDLNDFILALPLDGMILSCGAHVIADGNSIYEYPFPKQELQELIAYMQKHDIGFVLEGSKRNYLTPFAYSLFHNFVSTDNKVNSEMARIIMAQTGMLPLHEMKAEDMNQILKISIFSRSREYTQRMVHKLPKHLYGFLHENGHIDVLNGEISVRGINKATGIDRILAYYKKYSLVDTIAIGDSLNDMEMIQHAGIGIAMGNAVEPLKAVADYVTEDISDDGFYKAFQHLHIL